MSNTVKVWSNSTIMEYETSRDSMSPQEEIYRIKKILDECYQDLTKTEINRLKYRLDILQNPEKVRRKRCRRRYFSPSKLSIQTSTVIKDLIKMERFDEGYHDED